MYVQSTLQSDKVRPNLRIVEQNGQSTEVKRTPKRRIGLTEYPGTPAIPIGMKVSADTSSSKGFSALKMILASVVIALVGLLYIDHVFHTQKLHAEVQGLQREYEKARRHYADRKFTYDRMTGPAEVYARARQIGLVYSNTADPVILLKD